MALATFTPPMQPSVGASNKPKVSVLRAEFGDGYTQATASGLNHIRAEWNLTWEVLSPAQADAIESFLTTQGGYQSFLWTAPGKASPQKWSCQNWEVSTLNPLYQGHNFKSIKATFTESFNISQ